MKPDRGPHALALFLVLSLVGLVGGSGCGARALPAPAPWARIRVSSTELMAAGLGPVNDAPKVGKSQRFDSSSVDDAVDKFQAPSKNALDRKRGGFSGYK